VERPATTACIFFSTGVHRSDNWSPRGRRLQLPSPGPFPRVPVDGHRGPLAGVVGPTCGATSVAPHGITRTPSGAAPTSGHWCPRERSVPSNCRSPEGACLPALGHGLCGRRGQNRLTPHVTLAVRLRRLPAPSAQPGDANWAEVNSKREDPQPRRLSVNLPGSRALAECRGLFGEHPAREVKHTSRYHTVYGNAPLVVFDPPAGSHFWPTGVPLNDGYRAIAGRPSADPWARSV
jgi:hypothetical protein